MLGVDPSSFIGNEKSLQQPQQHYVLQLPQGIQLANNVNNCSIIFEDVHIPNNYRLEYSH